MLEENSGGYLELPARQTIYRPEAGAETGSEKVRYGVSRVRSIRHVICLAAELQFDVFPDGEIAEQRSVVDEHVRSTNCIAAEVSETPGRRRSEHIGIEGGGSVERTACNGRGCGDRAHTQASACQRIGGHSVWAAGGPSQDSGQFPIA